MIAAMGPQYQKYIWWKKYLTAFQMVQFVAIFTHQFQLLFVECDYPKGFMIWIGLHGVMFLFLFSDFYKQTYAKRAAAAKRREDAKLNGHANGDNNGACMPVLEDETALPNGKTHLNGHLNGHANGHNNNGSIANGLRSRKVQ